MKIGRFEIKIIIHPKICNGELKHKEFYHDGASIYECTKCNHTDIGYDSTNWDKHKKLY